MLMQEGKKHFARSLFSYEIINLVILEGKLCPPTKKKKKVKVIQSYKSEKVDILQTLLPRGHSTFP